MIFSVLRFLEKLVFSRLSGRLRICLTEVLIIV